MSATCSFRRRLRDLVRSSALAALTAAVAFAPTPLRADQGGISFWLPGAFGSLAATPVTPGWAMGTIYLHNSVSAGGEVAASRDGEFGAKNRAEGWNVWLTFAISPSAEAHMAAKPVIRK